MKVIMIVREVPSQLCSQRSMHSYKIESNEHHADIDPDFFFVLANGLWFM
jgi:hypothetical protein